ncbi:hypothetical protein [Anaerovibrio slackiae]|uniref:hypothetical protein n=1 Tax=Anaerovibrio slackiae TaxID=2652309 RepID=UPI003864F237
MKSIMFMLISVFITFTKKCFWGGIEISVNDIAGLVIRKSRMGRISIGKRLTVRTHVIFNVCSLRV